MMAFLKSKLGGFLIGSLLVALVVGYIALRIHAAGVNEERARVQQEGIDAKKRMDDAGARAPSDIDGVIERMRRGDF